MLPEETQPFAHAVGVLSLLLNCFAIAAYLSLQERLPVQDYSTVVVTAWTFALGLVPVAWLALLRTPDPLNWLLSYKELFAVMYAGAGPSAVNFFLLSYATRCAASLGASARYALPARRIAADSAAPTSLRLAVWLRSLDRSPPEMWAHRSPRRTYRFSHSLAARCSS